MSPFISVRVIQADKLAERIAAAKARRPALRVTVYTDAYLDAPQGLLPDYPQVGRAALARAGDGVKIAAQIHNKTVCVDNQTLLEGSFSWLSASRREALARHEVWWFFPGRGLGQLHQRAGAGNRVPGGSNGTSLTYCADLEATFIQQITWRFSVQVDCLTVLLR